MGAAAGTQSVAIQRGCPVAQHLWVTPKTSGTIAATTSESRPWAVGASEHQELHHGTEARRVQTDASTTPSCAGLRRDGVFAPSLALPQGPGHPVAFNSPVRVPRRRVTNISAPTKA